MILTEMSATNNKIIEFHVLEDHYCNEINLVCIIQNLQALIILFYLMTNNTYCKMVLFLVNHTLDMIDVKRRLMTHKHFSTSNSDSIFYYYRITIDKLLDGE